MSNTAISISDDNTKEIIYCTAEAMVFNGPLVAATAKVSANVCQCLACNPERLSSDRLLHLLFCFPFQQLNRLALCLWTFFSFPTPNNPFLSSSSSSDSDNYGLDEDLHSD